MNVIQLSFIVFAATALIVATLVMFLRDLFGRRRAKVDEGLKLPAVLPPDPSVTPKEQSWLARLAAETGSDFTAETALLAAILSGLLLGGAAFLWRNNLLAGTFGGIMGMLSVLALLFYLRRRRQTTMREQLPDVMELMARAVRAGESLDQAIALAGNSGLQPVAAEFQTCANQMKMGLSIEAVVRNLVGRVPMVETRILAMTLIVQRRRGGSLPSTLERIARVFRDRASFYRQFRAATALGRGSAALIALVAVGLDAYMILGHSDFAAILLATNAGRGVLALAIGLQVVAIAWMLWLFRPQF